MGDKLGFVRLPAVLLIIFFVGRLAMGASGASYEAANRVFSLVILQVHLALLWGAVGRRYKRYGLLDSVMVGALIGLVSQVLVFSGTVGSYLAGANTFFNLPEALNQTEPVSIGTAIGIRAAGLVVNTIFASVAAAIGWAFGAFIPESR